MREFQNDSAQRLDTVAMGIAQSSAECIPYKVERISIGRRMNCVRDWVAGRTVKWKTVGKIFVKNHSMLNGNKRVFNALDRDIAEDSESSLESH